MKTLYIYLLSYLFPIVTISFTGHGVDCQVGEWEEWTECDNPCGYGSRKRKRVVTQYPDNGGTNCPILKQRRACVGFEEEVCKQNLVNEMTIEKA
ncbi:hypothetical protein BgiMline_027711, partial [Biomphalaria glabrata]